MKHSDKYHPRKIKKVSETRIAFRNGVITTIAIQVVVLLIHKYFQTHSVSDVVYMVQGLISTIKGV